MHSSLRKTLVACGLVITTGPLCFTVWAQSYVDLEAERAAAQAAGRSPSVNSRSTGTSASVPADPYGAQPSQAYPATSYGVNNAPAAPAAIESDVDSAPVSSGSANAAPAMAATAAGSQMTGSDQGRLYLQIQQLQQEVMRLNGKMEEQAYELSALKEQSLQRYMDLDKRLGGAGAPASTTAPGGSTQTPKPVAGATEAIDASAVLAAPNSAPTSTSKAAPVAGSRAAPPKEQPGEANAYNAAYALVQGRKFDQAIPAFQQVLQRYPDGQYSANSHYWLGELYLVKQPPDLEASRQSFALLLSQYPDNSKAPDALYKLGKVQFLKGNREKAREYLDLVIKQYEGTNNAVVKLARDFIAQNY